MAFNSRKSLELQTQGLKRFTDLLYHRFDTQDGLFDCAWSESHENHIVVASGDGSIKLFDIALKVQNTNLLLIWPNI